MAAAAGVADADGADGGVWWCDTVVLSKKPPHVAFARERGW